MKETNWLEGFSVNTDKFKRAESAYGRLSMHFKATNEEQEAYEVILKIAEESGNVSPHQVAKQMIMHMVQSMKEAKKHHKNLKEEDKKIQRRKEKQREYAKKYYAKKRSEKESDKRLAEMDAHNSKVAGDLVRESPNYAN